MIPSNIHQELFFFLTLLHSILIADNNATIESKMGTQKAAAIAPLQAFSMAGSIFSGVKPSSTGHGRSLREHDAPSAI